MFSARLLVLGSAFAAGFCGGCSEPKMATVSTATVAPAREDWERVARLRVFFGHQSVGENILSGVTTLARESSVAASRLAVEDPGIPLEPGVFADRRIGRNTDPRSKLAEFAELLRAGIGERADVVLLKFCYVDLSQDTGPIEIFALYRKTMAALHAEFPDLRIVHVTTPLLTAPSTYRTRLKLLFGREVWEFGNLPQINQYNDMLRQAYQGREPVFDLARLESTRPDGTRRTFEMSGRTLEALIPEYSSDGGHLNELGQRVVASGLVRFLAALPDPAPRAANAR